MTNSRTRWMLPCVAGAIAASLVSATWAKDELPKAVRSVLAEESQISSSDWSRRQQLGEEVVKAKNSDEELWWHAGYVKVNGKWLPFEEANTPEPNSGHVREYLNRRERSEHTLPSQTMLANWCSQHGLAEQSQAHHYHGMMFTPRNVDISQSYQRMGYVRFGADWLSRHEAFEAQRDLTQYLQQLEAGTPAASRFADDMESGRLSEASLRDRLKQLTTANKIAALELVLATRSERCGQAAVEALRQIPTYQAAQALGRVAIYSPWLFVRDSAIASVKERRWDDVVPQWLSLMRSPITTELQRVTWGRHQGVLCLFRSERDFEIAVEQLWVWAPISPRRTFVRQDTAQLAAYENMLASRTRQRTKAVVERLSLIRNDQTEQLNERITETLRMTTGQRLSDSPNAWWDWWQDNTGLPSVSTDSKPVIVIVNENLRDNSPRPPPPRLILPIRTNGSCLVAGTPIWTERGLVAVERIQPGDLVLSKNVETGELAYKVVLHTTVREPFPVTRFEIGDEAIHATAGHHFWVSGRGWTKTRELAAEQPLHTPTGVIRVASTESADSAPTYNLVVADFHTYFVGKNAILSHDVFPPKPTNKVVPGLNDD